VKDDIIGDRFHRGTEQLLGEILEEMKKSKEQ